MTDPLVQRVAQAALAVIEWESYDEQLLLKAIGEVIESEGWEIVGEKTIEWRDTYGGYAKEVLDYEVNRKRPGRYLVKRLPDE